MKKLSGYSIYLLAYLLWAVSLIAGFWVLWRLREAVLTLTVVASMDRHAAGASERLQTSLEMRAMDVWSYLLMGALLITLIVVLESFYRNGAQQNQVWPRFSLVLALELGVLFLSELTITISTGAVQAVTWGDFIPPIVYLIPALLFGWLYATLRPKLKGA